MNIAIIGMRGSGKTTVSRILAERLGKKLISTDEETARRTKLSIGKYIKKHGMDKFRDAESDVIEALCDLDECVFDTNSSIVSRNENITNFKKNGLIVLLTADQKTIANRLGILPSRLNLDVEFIHRHKRAADYVIDTSDLEPESVCDLITHFVQMELQ